MTRAIKTELRWSLRQDHQAKQLIQLQMSNIKSYQLTHIDEITFEQPAEEQPLPLIRWNILWIQPDLLIAAPCFLFIWTDPLKDDSLFVKEASSVTVRVLFKRLNEGETSPASLKTLLNIIHVSLLNVLMHHSTCRRAATAPVSRKTQRIHESNRSKHSV